MRRTLPASRPLALALALAAALLACSGCVLNLNGWDGCNTDLFGQSVTCNSGRMSVDGTVLPFDRWVEVSADLAGLSRIELGTATDAIRVSGAPGTVATLKARLYSEIEGDGTAVFENGRLVGRSQAGGKVFINAIEGTVPAELALAAQSGTGMVEVSELAGSALVELKNGTGDVVLRHCTVGGVEADMGTGDLRLDGVRAPTLRVESGTGDATLAACHVPRLTIESGTGDVALTDCEVGTLHVESGTGDLLLDGGRFDKVEFDAGTGDLTQRNRVTIGSLKQS